MAIVAAGGNLTAASAGANGTKSITGAPTTADFDNNFAAVQEPALYGLLPGVLAGGVCTAAALVVTVPVGTRYFARGVWEVVTAANTINVPDAATTYVWGTSAGTLATSAAAGTAPAGFTRQTACLLTKAVAAAGAATVDNSVQHKARTVDATARIVTEGGTVLSARPAATKTAAFTLTAADDLILADATAGAFTLTLPPAASVAGREFTVKKTDASANAVTLDGDGAETIDGAATKGLSAQWVSARIRAVGNSWYVV